jgi:hypothetical protein
MHYVKKVNGVIVGGPWPLSDDRTKSPNSKWKLEQMNIQGFAFVADPVVAPTVDSLVAEKTREIAITELKKEGKLDSAGNVPKEIKP